MPFGDKLAELLDEREISQKEFAASLNISPTTLNGYIKNRRQPDFELVKQIAFVLNVTTDYLLDYSGRGITLSVKELSMILRLRELGTDEREIVFDLVNAASKRHKTSDKSSI